MVRCSCKLHHKTCTALCKCEAAEETCTNVLDKEVQSEESNLTNKYDD